MRILHVISSANPMGGGPIEGIKQLHGALLKMGHVTEVVTLDDPYEPWLAQMPMPVHPVGPGRSSYRYTRRFVPWLEEHAPDYSYVVVNGLWQYSSFGAWRALRRSRTPYCVYTHGMLDPWFKRTYPLKHMKKSLYWFWAEYRVLRDARVVCFTCEEERILARQSFRPYQVKEAVVNYGTALPTHDPETQRQAFFARYPDLRGKRFLLFLGRLHVKKGCDLLVKAFADIAQTDRELHLVMAGPDDTGLRHQLRGVVQNREIDKRIIWAGMLSGELKWGAFHTAEAFVLPSHQENFGIAVAEAMACGTPVLISNKVNIWREIAADGAGLVAEDDQAGTTQLLRNWLMLPSAAKKTMGERAHSTFCRRFEIEKAAASLVNAISVST